MKTEFQKCMDGEIFDGKDKFYGLCRHETKRSHLTGNVRAFGRKCPCRHRLSLRIRKKYIRRQ